MKYSILDFKKIFDSETSTFKVYFQDKFVMEVDHQGGENFDSPQLVSHPSHTINEYLPIPYITAGGYNNCDLYDIEGNKLSNFKFWAILSSPIIYNDKEYFQVRTPKNKSGIIDNKGNIVIPFEYEEDLMKGCFIKLRTNGRLYVKKNNQYGIIDIDNNIVEPFTDSWHDIKVKQLHDLGLWDDNKYVVVDGKLYDTEYAPKK